MEQGTDARRREFLGALRAGIEAPRNASNKWDELYGWFGRYANLPEGTDSGVIGKVITERKQIGNRADEMVRHDPKYMVISLLGDVEPAAVLRAIGARRFPSLRCVLFLRETLPISLVVFGD